MTNNNSIEIKRDKFGRPRVYLEEDCPVEEIGIECQREGGVGLHPPPNRLHVWWARRPLTVSRASVIGSLLPAGYPRDKFLRLMGILGDPVSGRKKIQEVISGIRTERVKDPYGYARAFTYNPKPHEMEDMKKAIKEVWGTDTPTVLDSFAGGGSIPFEAYRMGFNVILNELNPVASIIERATIEYPALFGAELAKDIEYWGNRIATQIEKELADCFPRNPGETDLCYIWVRTVSCPSCELVVPLSPNFWLDKNGKLGYQMQVPAKGKGNQCTFKIENVSSTFDPDKGTVTRGTGVCPRCKAVLEGEIIKKEAQNSRMGHQLAAIGFKIKGQSGRHFREPIELDLEGVDKAQNKFAKYLPGWEKKGLVPTERIPEGNKTREPLNSGILYWRDMFSPRQLLVHLTTLETILSQPWDQVKNKKKLEALRTYFQIIFNKGCNYNSLFSLYHPLRVVIANTFDRHDFAFIWSYGEIDGSGQLFRFSYNQISDSYSGLAKLIFQTKAQLDFQIGDAAQMKKLEQKRIEAMTIDPPYYDNVMYAELSDYFFVWMRKGIGDIFPNLFQTELTEKEAETVANVARFKEAGRGKTRALAEKDYEAKMLAAFRECHRVLRDDGVLTVMFTHKRVEAWDTLAMGLLEAGFSITASWPVHTESEHSLHQAKKNAAASTILLVCRKRPPTSGTAWWEDLAPSLDSYVRERAEDFAKRGLRGQDTFIACFGPALQVISEKWPVKTKEGKVIRPDEALDRARSVVSEWFMDQITEGKGKTVDPQTRFYIMAWYLFGAREFRYDEAHKLGIALGVDVENLISHKVLTKKGDNIRISKPQERARTASLHPDAKSYDWDLDYVQAAMHAYETGQSSELARFHQRTGAMTREGYKQAIAYLLDVLPRTDEVVENRLLDDMWNANLRDHVPRKARKTDPTFEKQRRLIDDKKWEEEPESEEEEDQ